MLPNRGATHRKLSTLWFDTGGRRPRGGREMVIKLYPFGFDESFRLALIFGALPFATYQCYGRGYEQTIMTILNSPARTLAKKKNE